MGNNTSRPQAPEEPEQETPKTTLPNQFKLRPMKQYSPMNSNTSPAANGFTPLLVVSDQKSTSTVPAKRSVSEVGDDPNAWNKKPRLHGRVELGTPLRENEADKGNGYAASGAPLKRSFDESMDEDPTPTKRSKIADDATPSLFFSPVLGHVESDEPSPPPSPPKEADGNSDSFFENPTGARRIKVQSKTEVPLEVPTEELGHLLRAQKANQPARLRRQAENFLRQKRKIGKHGIQSDSKDRSSGKPSSTNLWPGSTGIPGVHDSELGGDDAIQLPSKMPRYITRTKIVGKAGYRSRAQYREASIGSMEIQKSSTSRISSNDLIGF